MEILRLETVNGDGVYNDPSDDSIWSTYWSKYTEGSDGDEDRHPLPEHDKKFNENVSVFCENPKVLEFCELPLPLPHYAIYDGYGKYITKFGFLDQYQFLQWCYLPKWRKSFELGGEIFLSVYEVDDDFVVVGDSQVIFVHEKAVLVDRLPVTYYDTLE